MTALKSEEVKNAIVSKLLKIAPECKVYKEANSEPVYPHFFIHLLSGTDEEERKNHHILTYSFDLRYRVKSDSSTDTKLEQNLDAMALKLMADLNIIDCNNTKIRCEEKNYEKTDGVLHFFCKIKMQILNVDTADNTPKFNKLSVKIGVTNGY